MGSYINGVQYCDKCGRIMIGYVVSNGKQICLSCSLKEGIDDAVPDRTYPKYM